MLPFSIGPILYLVAGLSVLGIIYLGLDKYGDYRADQVHQLYEKAVEKTNEDLAEFSHEDTDRAVRVLTELKGNSAKAEGIASSHPYTAEQAEAITRIRSTGQ